MECITSADPLRAPQMGTMTSCPPRMFRQSNRDMSAHLATLSAMRLHELSLYHPLPVEPEAVAHDCALVLKAAVEFIRARMKDTEYTTGVDMETGRADRIMVAFHAECDPMFGRAAAALADAQPGRERARPGLHGSPP